MRHSEGGVLEKNKIFAHAYTCKHMYSLRRKHITKTWQEKQAEQLPAVKWPEWHEISKLVNAGSWNHGRCSLARKPNHRTSQKTNWAQLPVQPDLDQGCLLHLLTMTLQGIHLSCSVRHEVLERPLQFIQKPQHLPVLLRGQVLGMLREKVLNIKSKSIQLRFPFSHGLFQILRK